MKTSKQIEAAFKEDLQKLLNKHRAELQVMEDDKSYGMQSGICRITIEAVYVDNEATEEWTEFEIDTWMEPNQ